MRNIVLTKMKKSKILSLLLLCLLTFDVFAQVHVRGYYRKDGTYVRPHYRSAPDGVTWNNYSELGISKVHDSCTSHTTLSAQEHKTLHPSQEQLNEMLEKAREYWENL